MKPDCWTPFQKKDALTGINNICMEKQKQPAYISQTIYSIEILIINQGFFWAFFTQLLGGKN